MSLFVHSTQEDEHAGKYSKNAIKQLNTMVENQHIDKYQQIHVYRLLQSFTVRSTSAVLDSFAKFVIILRDSCYVELNWGYSWCLVI